MKRLIAILAAMLIAAQAQAQGLIRDAEIEATLETLLDPLVAAAGLPRGSVDVYIVNDREMNAFVTPGNNMFIHAGLVQRLDSADMLQAVMAHELGHIVSGHIAQRTVQGASAQRGSIAGLLLGIAVTAAGAPEAGIAIAHGSQGVARRGALAFSRGQEAGADQSSLTILERAGIDPGAALRTLGLFRGQELLSSAQLDPYTLTHPLSSQRYELLERRADNSALRGRPVPPALAEAYARMQAKFDGFLRAPSSAIARVEGRQDMAARIQRAIGLHRLPSPQQSIAEIDAAIAIEPNNPWLHELKGQFLYESGNAAAAVPSYRRALQLAPGAALVRAGLGQSLLALNQDAATREALGHLSAARDEVAG
ncbi:M48 family metalloprotease, partial [Roseobacter sp. HKCCA0434]|uniref:M48 family metalloprotease n=1 Tax=Roseobacter sp. HKCCA0434 TaxID=3079297 RepID=UPI0029058FFF